MNTRYTKLLVLIILIILLYKTFHYFQVIESDEDIEKVKISIYYEALCPDSRYFIVFQMLPMYKEFRKYIILDLIPYGKAQTVEIGQEIQFQCQHEALECYANKIHSCVIEFVKDPVIKLEYIACMIKDNQIPDAALERCGQELNIDYEPMAECARTRQGSLLLKKHGIRTNDLSPIISFIPTIELNDSQNLVSQPQILKNLKKALCIVLHNKPLKCV